MLFCNSDIPPSAKSLRSWNRGNCCQLSTWIDDYIKGTSFKKCIIWSVSNKLIVIITRLCSWALLFWMYSLMARTARLIQSKRASSVSDGISPAPNQTPSLKKSPKIKHVKISLVSLKVWRDVRIEKEWEKWQKAAVEKIGSIRWKYSCSVLYTTWHNQLMRLMIC